MSKSQKLVGNKWIFRRKELPGLEEVWKYKARLIAKGFTQKEVIDFNEIYSPVVRYTSIRILLSLVTQFNMESEQLNVTTTFLYGTLEERILMEQLEGFSETGLENKVCLLKNSLYGLKQSPMQWYCKFDEFMLKNEYTKSEFDSCVYFKKSGKDLGTYLLL